MVLLLEGDLVSWSLVMDKRGGHKDLCGLGRRSVKPYVHRRTELYCSSMPYLSLPFFVRPCEEAHARAYYSSRSGSYIETQGVTVGPVLVETLYNI
jgi:hypothetical protein